MHISYRGYQIARTPFGNLGIYLQGKLVRTVKGSVRYATDWIEKQN